MCASADAVMGPLQAADASKEAGPALSQAQSAEQEVRHARCCSRPAFSLREQLCSAVSSYRVALRSSCACAWQLERLRQSLAAAQKQEAAAKAVLGAATQAARAGRLLSDEERAQAEAPVLAPERSAQEQERKGAAAEQVLPCTSAKMDRTDWKDT